VDRVAAPRNEWGTILRETAPEKGAALAEADLPVDGSPREVQPLKKENLNRSIHIVYTLRGTQGRAQSVELTS